MIFILIVVFSLLFSLACLLPLYPLFVIIFSVLIGLMKYLREYGEKDRGLFLVSVSIISFVLSCILLVGVSRDLSKTNLIYEIGLYIFYLLFVFPLITHTIWKINPNKIIGLLLMGMVILSLILITPYYTMKTHPINETSVRESVKNVVVPDLLSVEKNLTNGKVENLNYYVWPAVLIKNKDFRYSIFLLEVIGIAGVISNQTHYSLFIGAGIGVIYFSTDFNKIVADGLQISFMIEPHMDREPNEIFVSVSYSQDYYIKTYHLIYAKQTNQIPKTSAILFGNWSIEAIILGGEKFPLKTFFQFSEIINVSISEREYMFSPKFDPEEIYFHPIELLVNYSPRLNLIESIYFYKYELFSILVALFAIEITREYLPEILKAIERSDYLASSEGEINTKDKGIARK